MFLTARPLTVEDFLNAVNFIAPKGYSLQSFITPNKDENGEDIDVTIPESSGFTKEDFKANEEGVTDTQYYTKKDMGNSRSFSRSTINLGEVPNSMPSQDDNFPAQLIKTTALGLTLKSPEIIDRRTTETEKDIQIAESYACFPKHTLFHFVKD